MTDQTKTVLLKAQVDQSAAAQGIKALRDIDAAAQQAQKDLLKINENAAQTSKEFQRLQEVSRVIGRDNAISDLTKQFVDLATATKDYEGQLINLRTSLRDVGASDTEINKATRAFKELQDQAEAAAGSAGRGLGNVEGIRRTGSALNQLGLGVIGEPIQKIGDILQVNKELDAVAKSMGLVGAASTAAETGTVAAAGGFGAVTASLSPLLLILAPVAAAFLEIKLILDLIKQRADAAVEAEKAKFAEEERQDELRKQNRDAGRTRSTEQNQQVVQDTFEDTEALQKRIEAKRKEIEANSAAYNALGSSINPGERARLGALGQELQKQFDDLSSRLNKSFAENQNASQVVQPVIDKREAEKKATDDLLGSTKDLIEQRQKDFSLTQLASDSAKTRLAQLKDEQKGLEDARAKLAQSGNTSKEVTDQIAEYDKALKDNAHSQEYLTKTAIPLIKAREDEQKAIENQKKALQEARKDWESFQNSLKKLGEVNKEIAKLESDRKAQVQREQEDDARQATRSAIEKDFATRIAAAKREEAEQSVRDKAAADNAAAETKRTQGLAKIDANFFDSELKAYAKYIDDEKKATDRANLQRLRTLEDAQTDLRSLAAKGDVAAFVERSNQAKTQLKRQAEDADLAARERQADYEKEIDDARAARQKQIDDLNASLEQERQARDAAAAQRIAEIEAQGQEANSKSAQLEQQLNDIREQWRKDDLQRQRDLEEQSYEERLQLQKDKQAEILAEATNFFNEWVNAMAQAAGPVVNLINTGLGLLGGLFPSHQSGLSYVPRDNYLARLDEGERVLTRRENAEYSASRKRGGGDVIKIDINNTVGDLATKSMLDEYQAVTVEGVQQAFVQMKGRG